MPTPHAAHRGQAPAAPALVATLAGCAAIHVLALALPSNALWGVNAFGDLPPAWAAALCALAAVGFLPPVARGGGAALERAARAWHARPALPLVLCVAAAFALCAAVTDAVRLVGDSMLRLGLLGTSLPPERLLPSVFPLDILVNAQLPRALMVLGMSGDTSLRLVGALMGGIYAGLVFEFLRERDEGQRALAATTLLALGGGVLLVFPGYDKFGPLVVGIALAALGAARMARGKGGAWALGLGCSVAVLAHRTGYLLLPAAAWLFVRGARSDRAGARRWVAPALLPFATALLLLPRGLEIWRRFDQPVQRSALAAAAGAGWPALLGARVVDSVNALFFYAPWWPLALVAAIVMRGAERATAPPARAGAARVGVGGPAALALACQAAVLLATLPPQGAGRDWDMNAGMGTLVTLVSCAVLVRAARAFDLRALWAPLLTSMGAIAVATWCLLGVESVQLARVDHFLSRTPAWSPEQRATALDFLGLRAFNGGAFDESARQFTRAIAAEPNPRFYYQAGLASWRARRYPEARRFALATLERAPSKADAWWILVAAARAEGDTLHAAAWLDSARAHGATRPPAGL